MTLRSLKMRGLVILVFGVCLVQTAEVKDSDGKILACYFLRTHRVPPSKIPPNLCTHIIFAFGLVSQDGITPASSSDVSSYSELIGLKKQNPSLKIMISLQKGFPAMVDGGPATMTTFTKNAISFLRKYGFDGVDFDWEFPKSSEKDNYMKFLSIFRNAIAEEGRSNVSSGLSPLLMSMALSNNANIAKRAYDVSAVNKYIDFATVMSYDLHLYSKGDNVTGYNSALYAPSGESKMYSVSGIIGFYLNAGLAPSKTLMGMPTYGRTYTLADQSKHGLHAPATGRGAGGPVIHAPGVYITMEVCMIQITATGGSRDAQAGVPYLYKGVTWLSYDDPESFDLKCKWALKSNLGGMGVWALPLDDISGTCPGGPFPMISTLKSCLN